MDHSVLFAGVNVKEGASVIDSVLMPGAVVERGAQVLLGAIIAEGRRDRRRRPWAKKQATSPSWAQQVNLPAGSAVKAGEQRAEVTIKSRG